MQSRRVSRSASQQGFGMLEPSVKQKLLQCFQRMNAEGVAVPCTVRPTLRQVPQPVRTRIAREPRWGGPAELDARPPDQGQPRLLVRVQERRRSSRPPASGVSLHSTAYSTRGPNCGFPSCTPSRTIGCTCIVLSRIDVARCQTRPANVNPHAARATQTNTSEIGYRNGSRNSRIRF